MTPLPVGNEKGPLTEVGSDSGVQGVVSWSGLVAGDDLERVLELQWPNSVIAYHAMLNDAQCNSLYLGATLPIRSYRYYLEPNGARPETVQRISRNYNLPIGRDSAEFFRRRAQRRFSFEKHLEDALRALVYGHYYFEQIGEIEMDPVTSFLVWNLRKLGIRAPRTLSEINVEEDGGLKSVRQNQGPMQKPIPVSQLVAYVWDREGSNWTGRSMLRAIYRNHIVKDRVLRVGAINIERAGGVPYANAPEGATGDQIRALDAIMRKFRVGEGAGVALPHGVQMKFAAAAGGDGAVNYIKLQNEEMARGWLQMFNVLGQTQTGSRALGSSFIDYFALAQETIARWFCDIFNEHVIEDDVEWNEGPDEQFAPLLRFETANAMDPAEGIQEALGEDDGLMVEDDGEVAAMIGRSTRLTTARRRAASVRTQQRRESGGVRAAISASPVLLPSRPLRRQPYDHELRAQVDFAALDISYDSALELAVQEVNALQAYQIDELHDAIVDADGDLSALADIEASPQHRDIIAQRLRQTASVAVAQAVQEASRQGVDIPRQDVDDIADALLDRADSVDKLLTSNLGQTASRQAIRLTGGALSPAEVADQTRNYLRTLTGSYLRDMLGGAIQAATNEGRKLVFGRDGEDGDLYASELLDTNTCSRCVHVDGTQYDSLTTATRDYPTGGYKDCDGRERCRGTLVKVYKTEVEPTLQEPFGA